MAITSLEYGRFQVKAGQLSGAWTARAFPKVGPGGRVAHEAKGKDLDGAIAALKDMIDAEAEERRSGRRHDDALDFDVPTAEEFGVALQSARLTPRQKMMLRAHAAADDAGLTATAIADAAGYRNFSSANAHYGKAGRLMAEAMGITPPDAPARDGQTLTGVLATGAAGQDPSAEVVWVMHPELRAAIQTVAL